MIKYFLALSLLTISSVQAANVVSLPISKPAQDKIIIYKHSYDYGRDNAYFVSFENGYGYDGITVYKNDYGKIFCYKMFFVGRFFARIASVDHPLKELVWYADHIYNKEDGAEKIFKMVESYYNYSRIEDLSD